MTGTGTVYCGAALSFSQTVRVILSTIHSITGRRSSADRPNAGIWVGLAKSSTRCFVGMVNWRWTTLLSPALAACFVHAQLSHCSAGRQLRQLKIVLLHAVSVPTWSSSLLLLIAAPNAAAAGRAFRPSAGTLQGLDVSSRLFPQVGVWGHLGVALACTDRQAALKPIQLS